MNNTNFAVKSQGCYCQKCAEKAERFNEKMMDAEDKMYRYLDKVRESNIVESKHFQNEVEAFAMGSNSRSSAINFHKAGRSFERAFSFAKVKEMINDKLTFPISYTYHKISDETYEITLTLFKTVKVEVNGEIKQRPVHIVVGYHESFYKHTRKKFKETTVVTAYYADCGKNTHFWKDNYIERACFCKKNEY